MTQSTSDRYGLSLHTSSPAAADHYIRALDAVMSQTYGALDEFRQAVNCDDGFALGHAGLAMTAMFGFNPAEARIHLQQAQAKAEGISRRERQHIDILDCWIGGNGPRTMGLLREHFQDHPRDIVLLRLAQRLFVAGCSGSGTVHYPPAFYDMLKALQPEYGDDWAFQGT